MIARDRDIAASSKRSARPRRPLRMTGMIEDSAGRGPIAGLDPGAFGRARALAGGAKPTGAFEEDGAVRLHGVVKYQKKNITATLALRHG